MLFWLIVSIMSGLAAMFMIVPLLRGQGGTVTDRESVNVAIFKDRLQEIEQALEDELVEQEEFDALRRDLEVSLLGNVNEERHTLTSGASIPKGAMLSVALFIPILAIGLYQFSLGAIEDVQLAEALKVVRAEGEHSEKMAALVSRLHARMQEQPDNFDGWFLLGQTQLGLRDYEGAARSFDYLSDRFPNDANMRSYYAQALYLGENRKLTERVRKEIDRVLKIDPHQTTMLEILGMDAIDRGESKTAAEHFNMALAGNISEQRAALIRQVMRTAQSQPPAAKPPLLAQQSIVRKSISRNESQAADESQSTVRLSVLVEAGANLTVDKRAAVFVFARAVNGPPMPLAISRMTVADLPRLVILTDEDAMLPEMKLSRFDEVQVVARISMTGNAIRKPGDFEAASETIHVRGHKQVIRLIIDRKI